MFAKDIEEKFMKRTIIRITVFLGGAFLMALLMLKITGTELWETFAISLGVSFYHFAMRLLVGYGLDRLLGNQVDYHRAWFQERNMEKKLYERLKVKQWKKCMPTFESSYFDRRLHSLEEIAQATCQAELVHEVIMVLSFAPMLLCKKFGAVGVFAVTSILAAMLDGAFVIMQRFNRPRLIRILEKRKDR